MLSFPPSITSSLNFSTALAWLCTLPRNAPSGVTAMIFTRPLHPMNGADLFQKLERIGHVGCFRPRDVAEVGGGLGAFVGLPAEVAADRQRIDRASLACAVVFAASKRRSVTAS